MANLYVPYINSNLISQYTEAFVDKYLLYSIIINKNTLLPEWGMVRDYDEFILNKFRGLQKYFEKRYHTRPCPAEFQMQTMNLFSPRNKSQGKRPINLEKLDQRTPSVFLGIFLKAAEQIQRQEFKEDWDVICATGAIDYHEKDGSLKLGSVGNIENKYNGEFKTEADKNGEKKYLFLYISEDKNEKEKMPEGKNLGENGNITVRCFLPGDTLEEVMQCLFKPFDYNYIFDPDEFEDDQIKFLDNMTNVYNRDKKSYHFIPGKGFEKIKESWLKDDWPGFFIHGEGGTGKSVTAMTVARHLVWTNKIYAPVWIKIDDNDIILEKINKEAINKFKDNDELKHIEAKHNELKHIEVKHDKLKELLVAQINKQLDINKLEKSKDKYLVIFDNLELPDTALKCFLETIIDIFPNHTIRPYLIITSRNICTNFHNINLLKLEEVNPPILTLENVVKFIKNVAEEMGPKYSEYIEKSEKNNTFEEFAETLSKKLGDIPELIITALSLLQHMDTVKLSREINKNLGGSKRPVREKRIEIYKMVFSYLEDIVKQVFYLFLETGDGKQILLDEFYEKIDNAEHWGKTPITKENLIEKLCILLDNNLIYKVEQKGKIFYGIKGIPYQTVLFENVKEFLGPLNESGEYLRDIFVDIGLQLEKALQNDQNSDIIEPLLQKMKAKNRELTKEHLFSAATHSSDQKIFSLLEKYGCRKDALDNKGKNVFHYAIIGGNITALKWFFGQVEYLFSSQTSYNSHNFFHYAAENGKNTDILDWLFEHTEYAEKLLFDKPNCCGKTVFHFAEKNSNNIEIINWLYKKANEYKKADELLTCKNKNGKTVFHYAIMNSNINLMKLLLQYSPKLIGINDNLDGTVFVFATLSGNIGVLNFLLEWLDEHKISAEDLLTYKTNYDATVFHIAAANSKDTDILDWLYTKTGKRADELLTCKAKNGQTVFHYAARNTNTDILGWLCKKVKQKDLLLCRSTCCDANIFNYATRYNNIDVMKWLLQRMPEFLMYKDNRKKTNFHYAVQYNSNIVTLNWLYEQAKKTEQAKELLSCRTRYNETVFHYAAEHNNNTDILNWLYVQVVKTEQTKELLLSCRTSYNETIFHYAVRNNNTNTADILNWLFLQAERTEQAKELLSCRTYKNETVFHYAAAYTKDTAVLNWLYQKVPHLISHLDKDGRSVFDHAKSKNNTVALNWFYQHASDFSWISKLLK